MKRIWVGAALALVACKGGDGDKGKAKVAAPDAGPHGITLPVADGKQIERKWTLLEYQPGGWSTLDGAELGDPADTAIVLAHGLPLPPPAALDSLTLAEDQPLVLLADADTKVGAIAPAIAKLAGTCWGLGVAGDELDALMPKTCPPPVMRAETVELVVYLAADGVWLAQTRIDEQAEVAMGDVEAQLRDLKASTFLAETDHFELAAYDGAPVRDVVSVLAAARKVGFTTWRWLPPARVHARIEIDLRVDVGADPEPMDETEAVPLGPDDVPSRFKPTGAPRDASAPTWKLKFEGSSGEFSHGLAREEVDRVVKSAKGRLTACGEREQAVGKLVVGFTVDAGGAVTSTAVDDKRSDLHDDALASCVMRQIKSLKFPAKGGAIVSYPLVYSAPAEPR